MTQPITQHNSVLKDQREAKGLTLEIVHEATKIPLDALKAIEQGYSTRILTPFYYKGFIKIYAEFLGLNVEDVLKEYHLDSKSASKSVVAPVKKAPKVLKPNQVIEKSQHVMTGLNNRKNRDLFSRAFIVIALIAVVFFIFKFTLPLIKLPKFAKNEQKTRQVVPTPVVKEHAESKEPKDVKDKVPFKLIRAESSNLKVGLSVRAVKDSWIQVKVDGKVVYAMAINKGTMENWSAYNQIELSGRNITDLDLEVNGKHLGPLGNGDRSIRKAVITRQGLTVKK